LVELLVLLRPQTWSGKVPSLFFTNLKVTRLKAMRPNWRKEQDKKRGFFC
jgi:hypothetical protein